MKLFQLDWRKKGFVTPPLNQEDCGSCYAFTIGTAVQAQAYKRDGDLTPLRLVTLLSKYENSPMETRYWLPYLSPSYTAMLSYCHTARVVDKSVQKPFALYLLYYF